MLRSQVVDVSGTFGPICRHFHHTGARGLQRAKPKSCRSAPKKSARKNSDLRPAQVSPPLLLEKLWINDRFRIRELLRFVFSVKLLVVPIHRRPTPRMARNASARVYSRPDTTGTAVHVHPDHVHVLSCTCGMFNALDNLHCTRVPYSYVPTSKCRYRTPMPTRLVLWSPTVQYSTYTLHVRTCARYRRSTRAGAGRAAGAVAARIAARRVREPALGADGRGDAEAGAAGALTRMDRNGLR